VLSVPRHLGRGVCAPALALVATAAALAAPSSAQAISASTVLATAQKAGNGDYGGQCKVFVNTTVASASKGKIALSKYHRGYAEAGATEVGLAQAGPGDIIQVTPAGSTDATAESLWRRGGPLHSAVVEANLGGGVFRVIDSNWSGSERVTRHVFSPETWAASKGGGIVKVWRFGQGAPSPTTSLGDGSFVRVAGTQGIYLIAGAAPLPVLDWDAVGGEAPVTEIDWSTLSNLAPFPVDGTVLRAGPGGPLYSVTRGVPRPMAGAPAPGRTVVVVDPLAIRNAGGPGAWSRLRSTEFAAKGVATRPRFTAAPRRVTRGKGFAVAATVRATSRGVPAGRCTIQRRAGTRWIDGGSGSVSQTGTCRMRVRLTATSTVRVSFIGATGWRSSHSPGRTIVVR